MTRQVDCTLVHGVKLGGIGIPDPRSSAERGHLASVEACDALVESLFGGSNLNYVGHRSYVRKASIRARKSREREESAALTEWKAEVGGQERG